MSNNFSQAPSNELTLEPAFENEVLFTEIQSEEADSISGGGFRKWFKKRWKGIVAGLSLGIAAIFTGGVVTANSDGDETVVGGEWEI